MERSKAILRNLIHTELPESQEISEMVREEVKAAEINEWGPDKLSSGPKIERNESIIIVEGRADVVNLLKKDLPNVIAVGGAKVPQSLLKLSREREATAFLDGDRGGDIILRELVNGGVDIDFVARAPTGKEVEELTRKEVMKCLKNKVPFEQEKEATRAVVRDKITPYQSHEDRKKIAVRKAELEAQYARERESPSIREIAREVEAEVKPIVRPFVPHVPPVRPMESAPRAAEIREIAAEPQKAFSEEPRPPREIFEPEPEPEPSASSGKKVTKEELSEELKELKGTMKARFYTEDYGLIKELPVREVIKSLEETQGIHAIVFDGIITQRLVDLAENKGAKILVGERLGNVNKKPERIELITRSK